MGSDRPNGSPACIATPSCVWRGWPGRTPGMPTTKSRRFPPETREVQLDEKWSFVAKRQVHCDPLDPADDHKELAKERLVAIASQDSAPPRTAQLAMTRMSVRRWSLLAVSRRGSGNAAKTFVSGWGGMAGDCLSTGIAGNPYAVSTS
jgi:hypothetical protein